LIYNTAIVLFLFFLLIPVFNILWVIFFDTGFVKSISTLSTGIILLLLKSLGLSGIVALISTFFGVILGFLIYKTTIRHKNIFRILIMIPLFISPYILAVAWKDAMMLFFNHTNSEKTYSFLAMILVHSTIYIPISILIIGSAMSGISKQLEESALMISGIKNMLFKILLPLIKPSIITSFVLILIFSISEFSVPAYFGVRVFTTEIFTQFSAFYNFNLAMLQSLILIFICVFLLLSERKRLSKSVFLSIGTRGSEVKLYNSKKIVVWGYSILIFAVIITVVIPIGILVFQSFKNGTSEFVEAFYLLLPTFGSSILLAISGAFITLIFGFIAAYYSEIFKLKQLNLMLLVLFAIPSTVLGIVLIKFYNNSIFNFIYSGFGILIIAYFGKYSFIAAKLIGNAIKQIPKSLEEAAVIEGIGFFKRLEKIVIPLVLPAIMASFIINFLFCLGDLGTAIMVYPPGAQILPIKVFTIMANAPESLTGSMVLIVFLLTMLLISILFFIYKKIIAKVNVNY